MTGPKPPQPPRPGGKPPNPKPAGPKGPPRTREDDDLDARIAAYVERVVANAPPLTAEQRRLIAACLPDPDQHPQVA